MRSPRYIRNLAERYEEVTNGPGLASPVSPGPWYSQALAAVPLTERQGHAVAWCMEGMEAGGMFGLVHAETGAGKTHVALPLLAAAAEVSPPAVLVAPTRLLVDQHAEKIGVLLPWIQVGRWTARHKEDGDILVASHAIASLPDPVSLLIIDEEQRFGAAFKAEIESRAGNVLYLTATPIPRTAVWLPLDVQQVEGYHFDKLKPRVRVGAYKQRVADRMIRREVGRGGQVLYVHHPIRDLPEINARLNAIAPTAIVHGRMKERELLRVAGAFRAGEYAILLCTTIVESGLDIPRVNTLVTDCAHLFGLGQLHQLLGRVGRAGEQGYAYLGWQGEPRELARWRPHACQVGSARVSRWDAEIRGSGLPGRTRQSGRYNERLPREMWA